MLFRSDASVVTTYGKFVAQTVFRSWFPSVVSIRASDTVLSQIRTNKRALLAPNTGCKTPLYQSAQLTAVASLKGPSNANIDSVDVTSLVKFKLKSPAQAKVLSLYGASKVRGVSAGVAEVTCCTGQSVRINVADDKPVSVAYLQAWALNRVELDPFKDDDVSFAKVHTSTVTATASHQLTREGQKAFIIAQAVFSDGLSQSITLSLNVTAMSKEIRVVRAQSPESPVQVQVAVGASPYSGDDLVRVSWQICEIGRASCRERV